MRILIADDHQLFRDALAAFVGRAEGGVEVLSADGLDDALALLGASAPVDIAVLDLNMPGMDGVGGIARFHSAWPEVPVVLMSGMAGRDDVTAAIDAGARGFLPKTLKASAFVTALRLVLAGEVFVPYGDLPEPATAGPAPAQAAVLPALTRRESDVLRGLLQGWSNKEIARDLDLQEVTIKLHVKSVCRKLEARNRTEAALRAVELGFRA